MATQTSAFWQSLVENGSVFSPRLIERVWVANRCIQLNSQQVASMPLRWFGPPSVQIPAWISSPDPVWFPNGIGDAVFAAVWSMYGWGDAFLLVTSRYSNGFPSGWTVLDPAQISVQAVGGRRVYRSGDMPLVTEDVVQVSRDPRGGLRGTPALRAYAASVNGLLASSELARAMMSENAIPNAVLKSKRKIDEDQAKLVQQRWVEASAVRRGAPAIIPPELDFEQLAFSPADLLLLDAQQYDARVIASAMGVPPFLVNLPLEGGLTYQSPEMLMESWWQTELRPGPARRLAEALTANMLPRGQGVTFDEREALAPTLPDLHKVWLEALQQGAVTEDEYRQAVLQLPPIVDAEGALAVLTEPGSAGASPADRNPPASVVALRPAQGATI